MRILFDHQIFHQQAYGGISRYFYELTKGLKESGHDVRNSIRYSENFYTKDRKYFRVGPFLSPGNFKGKTRITGYLNRNGSLMDIKRGNYDVFHPTYYETYFHRALPKNKPLVFTFHDLIHEKFGNKFLEFGKVSAALVENRKRLIERSSKIICISKNTKKDLMEIYSVNESKIEVVYHGSSLRTLEAERIDNEHSYILYVGDRKNYKNFLFFITSVVPLLKKERSLKVVCAGGGAFSKEELITLRSLGISSQVVQIPVPNDAMLARLYNNALCFVYPSLYEGFGIPVLEAFNCLCPVVASDSSSLTEVGGDAALYFDPTNADDIYYKVKKVVADSDLRAALIDKGRSQAKMFSWDKTVTNTIEVYKCVISS